MTYLNPPGQRGKYSVQAFHPADPLTNGPHIWEIGTTDKLGIAEYFAQSSAVGRIETKVVERQDRYSNIGTVLGIWFEGKRKRATSRSTPTART